MQKLQVFLSHVTVESTLADALRRHLTRDFIGLVDVFESSDRLSIPAGKRWLSEVTEALKRADLHLILCSPDAMLRPWIQFEAGAAHLRDIPIIPLCHSGLSLAQLPVPLSEYEGVKVCEQEGLLTLYRVIASTLGSSIPEIDFKAFGKEMASIEAEYLKQRTQTAAVTANPGEAVERIRNPKALCISSPQFLDLGFQNQLETVLKAFPEVIPHQRVFSSHELREAVTADGKFDIVHIAAYVCPRSGDLYFGDVDLNSGAGISKDPDILGADALASLLQIAEVKLVVIGSCDSIALGATLVSVCNVIAARDMVSARMMAAWVEAFYATLPHRSLLQALDHARKISQAPMRFYARQAGNVDVEFTRESTLAAV